MERQSRCELELDICVEHVLNRNEVGSQLNLKGRMGTPIPCPGHGNCYLLFKDQWYLCRL